MFLTDDEFEELQNMEFSQNDWLWFYTQAVENKLLEKLKAQEPFAFHHDEEGLSYSNHYTGTVPLYRHPLPPDDVVRDAERYRWLRSQGSGGYAICKWDNGAGDYFRCIAPAETLDAAIDAAIKVLK